MAQIAPKASGDTAAPRRASSDTPLVAARAGARGSTGAEARACAGAHVNAYVVNAYVVNAYVVNANVVNAYVANTPFDARAAGAQVAAEAAARPASQLPSALCALA